MRFLSAIPRLAWQALGIIILALSLLWWSNRRDKRLIEAFKANERVAARDTVIQQMTVEAAKRDTVYLKGKTVFRDVANNPASTKADVVKACKVLESACDSVRAINARLQDTLKAQTSELKKMKAVTLPRFSAYIEGMYDVVNSDWVPRGGVDFRIVGPISVTVAAEITARDSKARALAGLRYTFR